MDVVCHHLQQHGWQNAWCQGLGPYLSAGTVAQVNSVMLPGGIRAVVKVAWPQTRAKMVTDFKLFRHAKKILGALNLTNDENAYIVAAMFDAVDKNEAAVLAEFQMPREANALRAAGTLCGNDWNNAYRMWQQAIIQEGLVPPHLAPLVAVALGQSAAWSIRVPEPLVQYNTHSSILVMSHAQGESMQKLLDGSTGSAGVQEAAVVLIGYAVPFIGWLLLTRSSSHLAHVDPHPGNFRWDSQQQQLWVLDWGSHVILSNEQRLAFCQLIALVADDREEFLIADAARMFGANGSDDGELANVMKGILNASASHDAQNTINNAAVDGVLKEVHQDIVPVVRCLAILGGMLRTMQQKIQDQSTTAVELNLARLWKPFAAHGMTHF